ncbi:MAG: glucosidase [Chthoniobacterales bacterium]
MPKTKCSLYIDSPDNRLQFPPEVVRLLEDSRREQFWKLWGPYLSERQWSTVREDYSAGGDPWNYFPHEHARSRTYRWGEDGLLGLTDRYCRLCFSMTLWNGKDRMIKERLFGLSGPQGNHGEDVKELYYYLDATPTHSYLKALYKYPQAEYPYDELVEVNGKRSRLEQEYELLDTGIFDENRYYDVFIEYAKSSLQDVLIKFRIVNRGPEAAVLHALPTLWYRNTWSWGKIQEECLEKPEIKCEDGGLVATHKTFGSYRLDFEPGPDGKSPVFLFTENETNSEKLFNTPNSQPYVKDAFHEFLIHGKTDAVNPKQTGTKAAGHYVISIPAGEEVTLRLRLTKKEEASPHPFDSSFEDAFCARVAEANEYYDDRIDVGDDVEKRNLARQGYASLLWSKQFYYLVQSEWAEGDTNSPPPPPGHATRNIDWLNLFNRDILSMPDKWEYPYYCTWDTAFHTVSLCRVDSAYAKDQLIRFLREWYLHPNGQIPAYEWNFSDVNPPVHAWAAWRVYRLPWLSGKKDRDFLERVFQKLLLNFTWWVNRKDLDGNNLFAGGFLGLDNIGVFDRSKPLPTGGTLKQADGTAWMAFYCIHMLSIALELAQEDPVYEDLASKFFEHFVRIVHAMNELGGTGLWNEEDGFYYDMLEVDGKHVPLKVRSVVGFVPLFATAIIPKNYVDRLPDFSQRVSWFLEHRPMLAHHFQQLNTSNTHDHHLLAMTTRNHLERVLKIMFDENEFLSPYGIRSVSKYHEKNPYVYWVKDQAYSVDYEPGEGTTGMFGGNSNWRGPIWFPINYLIIESLRTYHHFYGDTFQVEFPTGSGKMMTLGAAAENLGKRLESIFLPDENGRRPCHGEQPRYAKDEAWKELVLFNEYFHAETGRGCGASHQTGWTALITDILNLEAHWDF